jgi:hypothetical protein
MDQLHLPPDLYGDLRDRSNASVSAWLRTLAELGRGRWGRRLLWVGLEEISRDNEKRSHGKSKSDRP